MRFAQLRIHKWRKNVKLIAMVVLIVILIIVVAHARPPIYDKNQLQNPHLVGAPADVVQMERDVAEGQPVPDIPEIVPANNNIQIDPLEGQNVQPPKKAHVIEEEKVLENNNDRKVDEVDADADAANAGPDRVEEGDQNPDGKRLEEDDNDVEAIADRNGRNQENKLNKPMGDHDLKFASDDKDGKRNHVRVPDVPEKLHLDDLQPDHLEGIKLEQDGHLNRDYKKEILLGNHEDVDEGTEEERGKKLRDIFHRVDANKDSFISLAEMEEWIVQKVQEHFDEAHEENEKIFHTLDMDNNGFVEWQEFHVQFLMAKGHDQQEAKKHAEDYETIPLESEAKEHLIRYKFRWAEADDDPQDNKLNMEEFKSFRHPEQSKNMLTKMVQDILDNLDRNSDKFVSEKEFVALPPGDVDTGWDESDKVWQEERRKEFRNVIDLNRDGKVNRDELKAYVDPSNPNHAALEAKNLVSLADLNNDGKLSLEEILENMDLFLGSKMVNTGKNFHDEF